MAEAIAVSLSAPGPEHPLSLTGSLTLNGEPVSVEIGIDRLGKAMAGERFDLQASLASSMIDVSWRGAVQSAPLPGLDGAFALDIASVATLASWLGQPLPDDQPDPGPLKIDAKLVAEGRTVALIEAVIAGDGLQATAHGSIEIGEITRVAFRLEGDRLDIDRYLPLPKPHGGEPRGMAMAAEDPLAGLSEIPFDLAALAALDIDVAIKLNAVAAMGYQAGPIAIAVQSRDAVLAHVRQLWGYDIHLEGIDLESGEVVFEAKA